jgi:hypothetical protein
MRLNKAQRLLDSFIKPIMSSLDFYRVGLLDYGRKTNEAVGLIAFPCIQTTQYFSFNCHVAVYFGSLDYWLRDDDDRKELPMRGIVGIPIHLMRDGQKYCEWEFHDANDLESHRDDIVADLQFLALPYIERFSRLTDLRKAAENPDASEPHTFGAEERITLLAAIRVVEGDSQGALEMLEMALREREGKLPKYWFDIKHLRNKILASIGSSNVSVSAGC